MSVTKGAVLSPRALNRALLARQHLLERTRIPVAEMVEHLVGLQAQASFPPYAGLWSRLQDFDPAVLGRMLTAGEVVRLTLMRGTIHLVTVRDALFLRPLLQDMLERRAGAVRRAIGESAFARLPGAVREILAEEPMGARDLARRLVERGIGDDEVQLGYVVPALVPMVQLPPRGVWGDGSRVLYEPLESWTGRDTDPDPSPDELVVRYLAAFGPASVMDLQNWCGLTRMKATFEGLRDRLVTFRDDDGRELFDLPDAPRPDPDVPAPVRLIGEFDNVLLGHRDRRRIVPEGYPGEEMLTHGRIVVNNLLVDGMLRASWWVERDGDRATLGVRPFGALSASERNAVGEEAERMLALTDPDAAHREVSFESPL